MNITVSSSLQKKVMPMKYGDTRIHRLTINKDICIGPKKQLITSTGTNQPGRQYPLFQTLRDTKTMEYNGPIIKISQVLAKSGRLRKAFISWTPTGLYR
uniref:Uncharacterized protein n=1 Tax=Manihot esculenta TaxID=3983 RepID=A0A2C9WAP1_MANES